MKHVDRRVVGRITAGLLAALACGGAFACSGLADEDAQATEDQVRIREATLKDFKERANKLVVLAREYKASADVTDILKPGWSKVARTQEGLRRDIGSLLKDLSTALEDTTVVEGLTILESQATEQKNNIKDAETKVASCIEAQDALERDASRAVVRAYDEANGALVVALEKVAKVFEDWLKIAPDEPKGVVIFGGRGWDPVKFSDTWVWNGTTWTQKTPSTSPPNYYYSAMMYDRESRNVVLVGSNGGEVFDTWEWNSTTWTQQPMNTQPLTFSYREAMAYDSGRKTVVFFGGYRDSMVTLEWDRTTWTPKNPSVSPPARGMHAMVYDSGRERVVLFGGNDGSSGFLSDTWEWDGETWTKQTPSVSPPGRTGHAMAYDSGRKKVVLFGGMSGAGPALSDTWEWDGRIWAQRTPSASPPARWDHAMAGQ